MSEKRGWWPSLYEMGADWDGSCPCVHGEIEGIKFDVSCWRTGSQPDGIGIEVDAPRYVEDLSKVHGRSVGLILAALIGDLWYLPVHIYYRDGEEDHLND